MSSFQLTESLYLRPTPNGVFYAVSEKNDDPIRGFLVELLKEKISPLLDEQSLVRLFKSESAESCKGLLFQAQTLSLVEGLDAPKDLSKEEGIGSALHELLGELSSVGKALLVDDMGFSLARSGIEADEAETLSALSADLTALQRRHSSRLAANLSLFSQGWGAVDGFGSSKVAMWPLFIGKNRFSLVVIGEPRLNKPAFTSLVWRLMVRYAERDTG